MRGSLYGGIGWLGIFTNLIRRFLKRQSWPLDLGLLGCWFTSHCHMDLMILNHRKLSAFNYLPMKPTLEATQPLVLNRSIVGLTCKQRTCTLRNDVNPKRKVYVTNAPPCLPCWLCRKVNENKNALKLWNHHGTPNFLKTQNQKNIAAARWLP